MVKKHTISINGVLYDAHTGLPADGSAAPRLEKPAIKKAASKSIPVTMDIARPKTAVHATAKKTPAKTRTPAQTSKVVHKTPVQRSTTLRRSHLSSPASKVAPSIRKKAPTRSVPTSPMITRFAPHPQPIPKPKREALGMAAPVHKTPAKAPAARPSSSAVKQHLIRQAEAKLTEKPVKKQASTVAKKTKKIRKKLGKQLLTVRRVALAGVAVLLLSGYFTYISLPGISVSLAANQAGVAAKYPNYRPDGYSFTGPVNAVPGSIEIKFKSNGGGEGYTIRQQASNWNANAVLDNYVLEASGGKYDTISQQGLTLYTYNHNIAWSNGGVFYTIESNDSLSPQQLVSIATSL